MNKNLLTLFPIFLIAVFTFVSCSEDDDFPAPVVNELELGYENSKVGYRGSELHIDASIVAEGKIDRIVVEIHPEGGHQHKSGQDGNDGEHGWEFEFTWTEFSGLLNTTFHEHVDIPMEAELGHYHFHFEVIDMQGKVTTVESEFEVKEAEANNF